MGLDKFGGPWKYLTFWNLWFQAVYFLICFVNDLRGRIPSEKKCACKMSRTKEALINSGSKLVRAEDYIYCTVAFPIGMFVGIIFWTLYAIDRELVNRPTKGSSLNLKKTSNCLSRYSPPLWTSMSPRT